jgi:hypothetical protein
MPSYSTQIGLKGVGFLKFYSEGWDTCGVLLSSGRSDLVLDLDEYGKCLLWQGHHCRNITNINADIGMKIRKETSAQNFIHYA